MEPMPCMGEAYCPDEHYCDRCGAHLYELGEVVCSTCVEELRRKFRKTDEEARIWAKIEEKISGKP